MDDVSVGDIMNDKLVTARESDGLLKTIKFMRATGIRRLPVVNDDNELGGILWWMILSTCFRSRSPISPG